MLELVNNAINVALKSGEKPTADALRLLKNSLINAKIAAGHDLTEAESIKIAQKEIKARIEARDIFLANDRPELAKKEEFERIVYEPYVPANLSPTEIDKIIAEQAATLDTGFTFAQLMPKVMLAAAGKADGREVAERVKSFIGGVK